MSHYPLNRRHMIFAGAAATGLGLATGACARQSARSLIATTRQGAVEGAPQNGAIAWKGVPFAQPPVGKLRGRPPQPPLARSGTLQTTAYRSTAIQMGFGPMRDRLMGDEDCLYLNVWAPADGRRNLPVMVWIHGGGFVMGSGSEPVYAGDYYASQGGVVFVTINYRVGGFGYFFNPQEAGSGNLGILDQIAALKWVRENIEAFGGDAGNVTVMGESAGAMSIGHLLGAPGAAGLFERAIIQSGGASHFFSNGEQAEIADRVLHHAGLKAGEHEKFLTLDVRAMQTAFREAFESGGDALIGPIAFHPGLDNVVFKQHPIRTAHAVPTVMAHCKTEMLTFAGMPGTPVFNGVLVKSEALAGAETWGKVKALYGSAIHNNVAPDLELRSDAFCVASSLKLSDSLTARGAKVWSYRFDYDKAAPFGAGHATDIRFSFYRGGEAAPAQGPGPAPGPMNAEEKALGALLWSTHVAFAKTGSPQVAALPTWPTHDPNTIPFMSFDESPSLMNDYMGAERRAAWAAIPPEKMI